MIDRTQLKILQDIAQLQVQVDRLNTLEASPVEALDKAVSNIMLLPSLRGFWPCSASGSGRQIQDAAPNGIHLTGPAAPASPELNYDGLAPYAQFTAASSQYATVADTTTHSIQGNEAIVASAVRGLTMGCWFYPDSVSADMALMAKDDDSGTPDRSYSIRYDATGNTLVFTISNDGSTAVTVDSVSDIATSAWSFVVGRFDPSTELKIWHWANNQMETATNTTSIPATINNGAQSFDLGRMAQGADYYDGRLSLCWLCAAYLSDAMITHLFEVTRGIFGI